MNLFGLIFLAVGIFSICGAGFDWDWFMYSRKAEFFVRILGRTGTRIFYALFGAGFVVVGILALVGAIEMK